MFAGKTGHLRGDHGPESVYFTHLFGFKNFFQAVFVKIFPFENEIGIFTNQEDSFGVRLRFNRNRLNFPAIVAHKPLFTQKGVAVFGGMTAAHIVIGKVRPHKVFIA